MEATDREVASSPGWAHSRWFVVKSYVRFLTFCPLGDDSTKEETVETKAGRCLVVTIVKGGRGGAKARNLPPSPGKPLLRPENREKQTNPL
ncbi:unnamed protein product [Spirodela intermedia]|uniref:Uncharacterized protein n=1 Tax=Spirodela intermedia TaxID=51605 RepID=A0A7I8KY12_SPIIN|nr:unnamed protein product [Spirodela intermedia]